jgi:hypothetical protein
MTDEPIDKDELAALRQALKDWRDWAQFVWLGGGAVNATDEVLRARICEMAIREGQLP